MKKTLRSSFSFVLVIGMVLFAELGCSRKPDDAKMSSDIQSKFNQDSGLALKQLTVQANDGVVTLSGNVDNEAQREAAGRQAASIPGVKTVVNNLQVGDLPPVSTTAESKPPAATPEMNAPTPEKSRPVTGKKSGKSRRSDAMGNSSKTGSASSSSDNMNAGSSTSDSMSASSAPAPPPAPADDKPSTPPPPPAPKKFIIDQGTQVSVRLIDPIDSEKNQTGETFHATLNAPLTSDGETAVPSGVELVGHLVSVKSAGKFAGQSEVVAQLDSLTSGGKTYNIQTDQYKKSGSSRGKNTAEKVGGGAAIGAIIGAIAGGGKGAAIGAAAGAGVGGGVQAATKSQQIKFPSETVLNFTLQAPVTVVQAPGPDASRQKLGDSQ